MHPQYKRKTLCALVPWKDLAGVLEIPLTSEALPARVDCPLCRGRLHVYDDTTKAGAWHHCLDCGSSGDLIELAAKVWEVAVPVAVAKLADAGIGIPEECLSDERLTNYVAKHITRPADFNEFWAASRSYLLKQQRSPTLNTLRARFKLRLDAAEDRWKAGPGELLGGATRDAVEKIFNPGSAGRRDRAGDYPSSKRVFRGRHWDDVLVAAYHDMPDRIAGFFFVGRGGKAEDRVYRKAPIHCNQEGEVKEFGLAGLNLAVKTSGPVIAVNDPMLMCRLQCRHMAVSASPLPLVAWHDSDVGATGSAWRCLGPRQVILWSWSPDYRAWKQAMRCDGKVAVIGPESDGSSTLDHYIRLQSSADLYRRIVKKAKHWAEAMSDAVTSNCEGWAESLAFDLRAAGVDVKNVATQLGRSAREVLLRVSTPRHEEQSVPCDSGRVVERPTGWWYSEKGSSVTQITSFGLRVDEIEINKRTEIYSGRLLMRGQEVPFSGNHEQVTKFIEPMLQTIAHRHKCGVVFIKHGWAKHLIRIAQAFKEPEYAGHQDA